MFELYNIVLKRFTSVVCLFLKTSLITNYERVCHSLNVSNSNESLTNDVVGINNCPGTYIM